MNISVVIPVLNQLDYTRACLASLGPDLARGVRVVVIDNGSDDSTTEFLAAGAEVTVIRNATNRGCAAAWNQGVQTASAEWVVLLNNDTLVTDGWLTEQIQYAEEHGVDIISPAIREGPLNYDLASYARAFTQEMRQVTRRGVANGVCFTVRRRVFEAIGLFDENFRIGQFEDADFFLRARRAGFKLGTTGRAFIHHFGSVTQKDLQRKQTARPYEAENRAYFRRKWGLNWGRRRWGKLTAKIIATRWRLAERCVHGHSMNEKWLVGRLQFH